MSPALAGRVFITEYQGSPEVMARRYLLDAVEMKIVIVKRKPEKAKHCRQR